MDMLSGHGGEGLHAMDYYTFWEHQVGQVSINYAEFNFSWWQLSSRSLSPVSPWCGAGEGGSADCRGGDWIQGTLSTVGGLAL